MKNIKRLPMFYKDDRKVSPFIFIYIMLFIWLIIKVI